MLRSILVDQAAAGREGLNLADALKVGVNLRTASCGSHGLKLAFHTVVLSTDFDRARPTPRGVAFDSTQEGFDDGENFRSVIAALDVTGPDLTLFAASIAAV